MSKNTKNDCLFVNLAEKLAGQNQIVSETIDEIVNNVIAEPNATERSDWAEIEKSLEKTINDEVPKPKSLARRRKPVIEDQVAE